MATENKKEIKVVEVKANLFGGYELGRDPWASGGYQPEPVQEPQQEPVQEEPTQEPEQEAPGQAAQELLPKPIRQSTLVERVIPTAPPSKEPPKEPLLHRLLPKTMQRREAAQRELDLYNERKRAERSREEAQYSILDGVVWSIREALRGHGITVSCLEDFADFQHKPLVSHVDFHLTEIGKTGFKGIIAQKFLEEFLKHNPKRVHMFTARTPLPEGVQVARHFAHDGLLLRGIGVYDISTDSHLVRIDCVYAIASEENLV